MSIEKKKRLRLTGNPDGHLAPHHLVNARFLFRHLTRQRLSGQLCYHADMSLTPSTMIPLGTKAPDFSLPDVVSGKTVTLQQVSDGKTATLVMFICAHCPYVIHVQEQLAQIGYDYQDTPLGIVAISSNDVESHPEDSPEKLKEMSEQQEFMFPLCYDESQKVAKAYSAACTPDFFLFDVDLKLVYRGQLDDTRPGNGKPTGQDLRTAINTTLSGEEVDSNQTPSSGCNIKWK